MFCTEKLPRFKIVKDDDVLNDGTPKIRHLADPFCNKVEENESSPPTSIISGVVANTNGSFAENG